jgi:hypothetical protein
MCDSILELQLFGIMVVFGSLGVFMGWIACRVFGTGMAEYDRGYEACLRNRARAARDVKRRTGRSDGEEAS